MNYTRFYDFCDEVISYVGYRLGRVFNADQFEIDAQDYDASRYSAAFVFINRSSQPAFRVRVYLQPGNKIQIIGNSFRLCEDPDHPPSPNDEVYVLEAVADIEVLRQWQFIKRMLNASSDDDSGGSDEGESTATESGTTNSVNFITTLNGSGSGYYYSVVELDGYLYAAGYQNSQAQGYYDGLLVKYDTDGNLIWQRDLGEVKYDFINALTTDGSFIYAAGTHYAQGQNTSDALIVKYDTNGNLVWQYCVGSSGNEEFNAIVSDGTYLYAAGRQDAQSEGSWDAFIVKCDASGNLIWQRSLGGSSTDIFYALTLNGTFIYAAGVQASQGQGNYDALIAKYDTDGNLIWQRGLGTSVDEYFYSIATDETYVYAAGYRYTYGQGSNDAILVKYDTNGNLIWQRSLKGSSDVRIDTLASDGASLYIAGGYYILGAGNYSAFLVKYDTNGNLIWQRSLNRTSYTYFYALTTDGARLYAAGYLSSSNGYSASALLASIPVNGEITLDVLGSLGLGWTQASFTNSEITLTAYTPTLTANTLSLPRYTSTLMNRPLALSPSYSTI